MPRPTEHRAYTALRTQAVYTAQQSNLSNTASKALQDYRRAKARMTRAKVRETALVALKCLSVGLGLTVVAYGYLVALDWAVAKCEGCLVTDAGFYCNYDGSFSKLARFSADWSLAGPIIERERMAVWFENVPDNFFASGPLLMNTPEESEEFYHLPVPSTGPTPLIAAMRCYVASKLGKTVDVPSELV